MLLNIYADSFNQTSKLLFVNSIPVPLIVRDHLQACLSELDFSIFLNKKKKIQKGLLPDLATTPKS